MLCMILHFRSLLAASAVGVVKITNAGGWYGFGDSWFLLDAVTHFKTMTDLQENLCGEEIQERSIGTSLPTVEQVLAVLGYGTW